MCLRYKVKNRWSVPSIEAIRFLKTWSISKPSPHFPALQPLCLWRVAIQKHSLGSPAEVQYIYLTAWVSLRASRSFSWLHGLTCHACPCQCPRYALRFVPLLADACPHGPTPQTSLPLSCPAPQTGRPRHRPLVHLPHSCFTSLTCSTHLRVLPMDATSHCRDAPRSGLGPPAVASAEDLEPRSLSVPRQIRRSTVFTAKARRGGGTATWASARSSSGRP
jgi:hypothetical protein